jgi:glycosyltransferase involved in cell wall biosynthesis
MPHRVSVVTPSYNQGRFIQRTIDSVLSQQFCGSLQYLVMDGGSQDGTREILSRYGSSVQWVSERDGGQADAVNKGLARATGDVIGWLNSDDVYYPGAIAAVCAIFESHPEVDVVYGDANHIDEGDLVLEPYGTEEWDFQHLLEVCYICQPATFFRKSVVERFGQLDPDLQLCMDYEYWIRLGKSGAVFHWLRQVLAGSRLHAETKTLGARVRVHREINEMLSRHAGRVPDRWLYNYAHAVVDGKGIPRSNRQLFPVLASALSLYAGLRWNHRLSIAMRKTTGAWVASAVREFCKAKFRK